MENQDIRLKARGSGVALWQVANHLGISEPTLTRLLRKKVDKDTRKMLMDAIRDVREEQEAKA